jgi:Domain of unknown function (DUF4465)
MNRWMFFALASLAISASSARADLISTFEDLGVPANSFVNNAGAAGYFVSGGSSFNNSFSSQFNAWSGWSVSSTTDTTTAGFTNQYSAITGSGAVGSATYGVAFDFNPSDSYVNLASGYNPVSAQITNTTYAYLSMKNGDQFAKKFGAGDDFLLTITGYKGLNGIGPTVGSSVNFYLANFLGSNAYIVNTWQTVNLTSLAGSKSLGFALSSTDNGPFGMNTPAYFALDNLDLAPLASVPEPSVVILGLIGAGAGLIFRGRRALMGGVRQRRK